MKLEGEMFEISRVDEHGDNDIAVADLVDADVSRYGLDLEILEGPLLARVWMEKENSRTLVFHLNQSGLFCSNLNNDDFPWVSALSQDLSGRLKDDKGRTFDGDGSLYSHPDDLVSIARNERATEEWEATHRRKKLLTRVAVGLLVLSILLGPALINRL
jgi:hypothetical protein